MSKQGEDEKAAPPQAPLQPASPPPTHQPPRPGTANSADVVSSKHEITSEWQVVITTPLSTGLERHSRSKIDFANFSSALRLSRFMPDEVISTSTELSRVEAGTPLPLKPQPRAFRFLRWNFFSVYRRMFTIILTINLVAIILFLLQLKYDRAITSYGNAATAASANFFVGIAMRNEHVVNLLFRIACSLPVWTPLSLRRRAAKVYSYGGVHSGCGASGVFWYVVFAILAIRQYPRNGPIGTALAVTTGITLMLLLIILVFSYPAIRIKLHNQFEATHRYGGWAAILVLWVQTMLLVISDAESHRLSFSDALIRSPPFWLLVGITCLIIYPWLRLRSRVVEVEQLSKHATRIHFKYANMETCLGVRLTDAPLRETHGFATIPNYSDEEKGFSVLVSNAGDWTSKIINNPPRRLWVKGAPTMGVMRVALMFKKVLVVATGSGIGPCLSLLQAYPDYPMRVLWSAPHPEKTYGDKIIKSIFRSDPDAVIIDTKRTGRPDLVKLAYGLFVEAECEAAIVISNPVVTKKVVYGLETRGIPAYGPIFDS